MTVGFDAMHITGVSGIETYARNLVRALAASSSDLRLRLFTARSKGDEVRALFADLPNVDVDARFLHPLALGPAGAPLVRMLRARAWRAIAASVDVVHFPDPLHLVSRVPNAVVTVHDIIPAYPESWARSSTSQRQVAVLRRIARDTCRIIAPSTFVMNEIVRVFGVDAARIHVVAEAAATHFTPIGPDPVLLRRCGINDGERFFVSVGRLDPRKNLALTIEAFARATAPRPDIKLLIVGHGTGEMDASLRATAVTCGVSDRVLFVRGITDAELVHLYNGAIALIFVSLSEGFGLPAVEAMQCGCPVIAANATSLPEVIGDAGIPVDEHDADAIARAITVLLDNEAMRADLKTRSVTRAQQFSWQRAARETLAVYHSRL